ncbi:interleukin-17C [Eleginops maclovinus]|uniref:interleukin-17C n=1 Tax=Eleginops maclovinus TaxID=56733 RepID=UPI0030808792
MDIKQIFLFGLLLAPIWSFRSRRCLPEQDLREAAKKKLKERFFLEASGKQLEQQLDSTYSCPLKMFSQRPPTHLNGRSLSPWRYVSETIEDHFPSTYSRAQCLCTGCVLIQNSSLVESHDYNSAYIVQSKMFLKKELCKDKKTYRLMPVRKDVPVGCTCTRANSTP